MEYKKANFENLEVWKRSCHLSVELFKVLENCKLFGLKDQILRSAVSIPSNIAEGSERSSDADYVRFLYYSKGSSAELRTQLYIAQKSGILNPELSNNYINETKEISRMIQGLIGKIKRDNKKQKAKSIKWIALLALGF
jgi:four helix bundle protein